MTFLAAHPIFWKVGTFTLFTHGFFFALGALVALGIMNSLARKANISRQNLWSEVAIIFITSLGVARLGFFLIYPSQFKGIGQLLSLWQGGLVSFFGLLGGLLAAILLFKSYPAPEQSQRFSILAIGGAFGWSIGRIGNYYAADSVGIRHPSWQLFYGRVPIQLFESLLTFSLGLLLLFWWYRRPNKRENYLFISLAAYALIRFLVDFWRDEAVYNDLRVSQWVSLGIGILLALVYVTVLLRRKMVIHTGR